MKKLNLPRLIRYATVASLTLPTSVMAANDAFQDFLFTACESAASDLAARCTESGGGNVSGDSESSLNPSQMLTQSANALQEAKANVRAIRDQDDTSRADRQRQVIESAGLKGLGVVLMADTSTLERDETDLERGYEIDMTSLKVALDYRYTDDFIVGVLLGYGSTESTMDRYDPSGAFPDYNPSSSGSNESDTISISLYTTKYFGESFYVDAIGSYVDADYTFERNAVFQVSARNFDLPVDTRGETSGNQLALGLGAGYDQSAGSLTYGVYGRFDYQDSSIDGYRETGGNGLALSVGSADVDQTIVTLGARLSSAISTGTGVLVPQAFVEFENKSGADAPQSKVSFVEDSANSALQLEGDDPDSSLYRLGLSVTGVWSHGLSAFLAYSPDFQEDNFDRFQINGGMRIEF